MHRDDTKNFPKKITRGEYCKILFTNADIVLIKTKGKRQFTCPKTGKEKCHVANVYLHYLQSCLNGYDSKFRFKSVVVLRWANCLKVLVRRSQNKICKWKNTFFSLFKMDVNSLFSFCQKKDDPLDKYKFKVNNRCSSWKEVSNMYYLNNKNTRALFLCVYCKLWTNLKRCFSVSVVLWEQF